MPTLKPISLPVSLCFNRLVVVSNGLQLYRFSPTFTILWHLRANALDCELERSISQFLQTLLAARLLSRPLVSALAWLWGRQAGRSRIERLELLIERQWAKPNNTRDRRFGSDNNNWGLSQPIIALTLSRSASFACYCCCCCLYRGGSSDVYGFLQRDQQNNNNYHH